MRKAPRRWGICALCFLLSACTLSLSQEEKTRHVFSTPSLEKSELVASASGVFAVSEWPSSTWWQQYGFLELNALIERALAQNPTIQAVEQRIEQARSAAIIARSELFPLIYFDASDEWEFLSKNGLYRALNPDLPLSNQQIDFSLSFSYEFDFWGKYRNLYKAALSRVAAERAEKAQVELIVSAALAQAYFGLRTQRVRKGLYEQLYQARAFYFRLQDQMRESALYGKLDPLLSEEKVFEAAQWIEQIDQEIALSTHLVHLLAGEGPDAPLELTESFSAIAPLLALPQRVSLELIAHRPDLRAQLCRMEGLAHEVGAAKANYWPDVNLVGLIGFQSGSWAQLWEWASKTIGATPGLSLPVYTSGAIGAGVDAKRAEFERAVQDYNELMLVSCQQVADLIALGSAVYHKKEQQQGIVLNASERYELTRLRQQSGIDSALTLYSQVEELLQKQLEDVQLLYEQYKAHVGLMKALGGGYS
jgi:NodT family efflux transporter outer membrane factor (OMF) lipoprotein